MRRKTTSAIPTDRLENNSEAEQDLQLQLEKITARIKTEKMLSAQLQLDHSKLQENLSFLHNEKSQIDYKLQNRLQKQHNLLQRNVFKTIYLTDKAKVDNSNLRNDINELRKVKAHHLNQIKNYSRKVTNCVTITREHQDANSFHQVNRDNSVQQIKLLRSKSEHRQIKYKSQFKALNNQLSQLSLTPRIHEFDSRIEKALNADKYCNSQQVTERLVKYWKGKVRNKFKQYSQNVRQTEKIRQMLQQISDETGIVDINSICQSIEDFYSEQDRLTLHQAMLSSEIAHQRNVAQQLGRQKQYLEQQTIASAVKSIKGGMEIMDRYRSKMRRKIEKIQEVGLHVQQSFESVKGIVSQFSCFDLKMPMEKFANIEAENYLNPKTVYSLLGYLEDLVTRLPQARLPSSSPSPSPKRRRQNFSIHTAFLLDDQLKHLGDQDNEPLPFPVLIARAKDLSHMFKRSRRSKKILQIDFNVKLYLNQYYLPYNQPFQLSIYEKFIRIICKPLLRVQQYPLSSNSQLDLISSFYPPAANGSYPDSKIRSHYLYQQLNNDSNDRTYSFLTKYQHSNNFSQQQDRSIKECKHFDSTRMLGMVLT